jgi:hypothetical protein
MFAIVEDIRAPSKERLRLLTLSISKLISITFFVDIDLLIGGCYIVLSKRAKFYLFGYGWIVFFTVDFVEDYIAGFFLKSTLLYLLLAEYFVFVYFI